MKEQERATVQGHLDFDRPIRGADRNEDLLDRADPSSDDLLLPSLDEEITLLDVTGDRGVPVIQSLVLDHLLMHEGPTVWADTNGFATTSTFARIAPSRRLLNRVHVARAFTAYQHYNLIDNLAGTINQLIRDRATRRIDRRTAGSESDESEVTPSLIVAPAIDARYRSAESLSREQAQTLQVRALATLRDYAKGYDVPVLLTRSKQDEFSAPVEAAADRHLECEQTRMGPRFVGDKFETLVYPVGDGSYYQTTFAYWKQVLRARADQTGIEAVPAGPSADTDPSVGTGLTAAGDSASMKSDPLADAWINGGGL